MTALNMHWMLGARRAYCFVRSGTLDDFTISTVSCFETTRKKSAFSVCPLVEARSLSPDASLAHKSLHDPVRHLRAPKIIQLIHKPDQTLVFHKVACILLDCIRRVLRKNGIQQHPQGEPGKLRLHKRQHFDRFLVIVCSRAVPLRWYVFQVFVINFRELNRVEWPRRKADWGWGEPREELGTMLLKASKSSESESSEYRP